MAGRIIIGTSSWADPGFVADWYPPDMAARDRLAWYAERFEAVEVNSTFYAVPQVQTVERWAEVTPPGFTFDVKLHRLLSRHAAPVDSLPPDLRDEVDVGPRGRVKLDHGIELSLADKIIESIEPLERAGKLGALLLQLSPAFAPGEHDLKELDPLLERLSPRPVAIELRHKGWVAPERLEETLEAFEEREAAFVCVDAPEGKHVTMMPGVDAVTREGLAYFRLHGRNAEGYVSGKTVAERFGWVYSDDELHELAGRIRGLAAQGADTRVMFNNNRSSDAPNSARRMREIVGQDPGPEPVRTPAQGTLL